MKRMLFLLALLASFVTGFSQEKTATADKVVTKQSFFLYDWWITRIQRDTNFVGHNDYIPTSDAVKKFVEGRDNNFYTKSQLQTSGGALVHWDNVTNKPTILSTNMYNADGTLTSDRTVDGNAKILTYNNIGQMSFNTTGPQNYFALSSNRQGWLEVMAGYAQMRARDLANNKGAQIELFDDISSTTQGSIKFTAPELFIATPLVQVYDTVNYKPFAYNSATGEWKSMPFWPQVIKSNIYTADGTLTGNRLVTQGGNSMTFNGGNLFATSQSDGTSTKGLVVSSANALLQATNAGATNTALVSAAFSGLDPLVKLQANRTNTSSVSVYPDSLILLSPDVRMRNIPITLDTTTYKSYAIDPVTGKSKWIYWGATVNNLYNKDGSLTGPRTILQNGLPLSFSGGNWDASYFVLDPPNGVQTSGQLLVRSNTAQVAAGNAWGSGALQAFTGNSPSQSYLLMQSIYQTNRKSSITVAADSIAFQPGGNGAVNFDSLKTAPLDTVSYKPTAWNAVTGEFRKFPYWLGTGTGGTSGGGPVLQTVFANLGDGDTVLVKINDSTFAWKSDSIYAASNKISITKSISDTMRKYGIDVNEANLTLNNIGGTLAATKGGTGFSSFTKGDLMPAQSSTALIKLGVGTNGQVLTADNSQTSGMKWADPSGGSGGGTSDYVKLKDTVINGASSASFYIEAWTDGTYRELEFRFDEFQTATNDNKVNIQISHDGTSYVTSNVYVKGGAAPIDKFNFITNMSTSTNASSNGVFTIYDPAQTTRWRMCKGDAIVYQSSANDLSQVNGFLVAETGALKGVRVLAEAGNFSIGRIRIYGRK